MSYESDRQWSDQFIPEIRRIVGPHLLEPSSVEVDTRQAADLVVLLARNVTIAARVRRPGYADKYAHDFTIRSHRDSGAKTELAKLVEGWGDWMFYGHAALGATLIRWMLIDLHEWRKTLITSGWRHGGWRHLAQQQSNRDGTHFLAFDIRKFPSALIASSHELLQEVAA